MNDTAFYYDDRFLNHSNGEGHPERPQRLEAVVAKLKNDGIWNRLSHCNFDAADDELLLLCHTPQHIELLKSAAQAGGRAIDGDTFVGPQSEFVARLAVGAACAAVDGVLNGGARRAFVCARPPGHHAESNRAMGFCLYNAVAIAARHALSTHGATRVAILDWDVHHGNGTQEIFYNDGSVFFASCHQSPFYPGTGSASERGAGSGQGATLNFPLRAGAGDTEYSVVWERMLKATEEFAPQLILLSAGFDAHENDPLGGMKVTAQAFGAMMKSTLETATRCCDGRLVALLEGGYDLEGLSESVAEALEAMLQYSELSTE